MTIQEGTRATTIEFVLERLEAGDGQPAAAWLAERLNELDDAITSALDGAGRAARSDQIDHFVGVVCGDRRDVDEIVLVDGTRVRWHLGRSRASTKWVVDTSGRRYV